MGPPASAAASPERRSRCRSFGPLPGPSLRRGIDPAAEAANRTGAAGGVSATLCSPAWDDYPLTAPVVSEPLIWRYMISPRIVGGSAPTIITAEARPHCTPPPLAAKKNEAPTVTGTA